MSEFVQGVLVGLAVVVVAIVLVLVAVALYSEWRLRKDERDEVKRRNTSYHKPEEHSDTCVTHLGPVADGMEYCDCGAEESG